MYSMPCSLSTQSFSPSVEGKYSVPSSLVTSSQLLYQTQGFCVWKLSLGFPSSFPSIKCSNTTPREDRNKKDMHGWYSLMMGLLFAHYAMGNNNV